MARATSDHVFNATIWDVLVDPSYQVSNRNLIIAFVYFDWCGTLYSMNKNKER